MPKYAAFDPNAPQPSRVIGWYDTDLIDYPSLPPANELLQLSDEDWTARFDRPYVQSGALVAPPAPSLDVVKAERTATLYTACDTAITAGTTSNALGATYTYPTTLMDQHNMNSSVLDAVAPGIDTATWTTPFMCADATGAWAMRPHTATQIIAAARDLKAYILGQRQKLATLVSQVNAATTADAVNAVAWS